MFSKYVRLTAEPVRNLLIYLRYSDSHLIRADCDSKWYLFYLTVPMLYLQDLKENLKRTRYYTQRALSIWKIIVFMVFIIVSLHLQEDDPFSFFTKASEAFGPREYIVEEVSYKKIIRK